jgi:hypothetical protein
MSGELFSSDHCHIRLKDAYDDDARVAYENLVANTIYDAHTNFLGLIQWVFSWHCSLLLFFLHISFHA